jgi:hypothetical protein
MLAVWLLRVQRASGAVSGGLSPDSEPPACLAEVAENSAFALQWCARLKKDRAMTTTDWVLSGALAVVGLVVISSMLW